MPSRDVENRHGTANHAEMELLKQLDRIIRRAERGGTMLSALLHDLRATRTALRSGTVDVVRLRWLSRAARDFIAHGIATDSHTHTLSHLAGPRLVKS